MRLIFAGPRGPYDVALPEGAGSFEDLPILVTANGVAAEWFVEVDNTNGAGVRSLSGMARDGSGLWFELSLGSIPQMRYWGAGKVERVDDLAL
jgi:hypothetical protein